MRHFWPDFQPTIVLLFSRWQTEVEDSTVSACRFIFLLLIIVHLSCRFLNLCCPLASDLMMASGLFNVLHRQRIRPWNCPCLLLLFLLRGFDYYLLPPTYELSLKTGIDCNSNFWWLFELNVSDPRVRNVADKDFKRIQHSLWLG